jgi:hypothetical protein
VIDHLIRAESRSVWLTYAQDQGWVDEQDHPTPGTLIDEIGPVVVTPAVIDAETFTVTTPAVMDDWHHVNVRLLDPPAVSTGFANAKAIDVRGVTAAEIGVEPTRIQLLSAADIETPVRVWADGMHHLAENAPERAKPAPKTKPKQAKAKK